MMVVYSNDHEVLITTQDKEQVLLREYFDEGGRDKDDYDRSVCDGVVEIETRMKVSG